MDHSLLNIPNTDTKIYSSRHGSELLIDFPDTLHHLLPQSPKNLTIQAKFKIILSILSELPVQA